MGSRQSLLGLLQVFIARRRSSAVKKIFDNFDKVFPIIMVQGIDSIIVPSLRS